MARKPKDVIQSTKIIEKVFDERSFIDGVFNDEYILVIGSGVILNRNQFPKSDGDINKYIIDEINNDRRKDRVNFIDYRNFTDVFRGTLLDEIDPIYNLLTDGYDYALSDMSTELKNLLRTKLFKFILTTCIDNYIETLMRDIWGEELRIVNIFDRQSLKDFQISLEKSRLNKYVQPTLFYAFGKVIAGKPKPRCYVETDVDAIKTIEKWMMEIDNKYIVPFLKEKRIISLGCKFDDWYFRFFWYILTRSFDDASRQGRKDIDGNLLTCDNLAAAFDANDPSDCKLKDYLFHRGVCMHDDVWQFMSHIHTLLTSTAMDSPFRQIVLEKRRHGGVFISYKRCDILVARELFCKLARENGLNVWFDNVSLHVGDDYGSMIKDAINQAKIFIPILSPSISEDLQKFGDSIDTFYSNEWRWASDNKQIIVMPVAVGGYDLRSDVNKIFERIVGHQSSGINMSDNYIDSYSFEKTGYNKLLESIINILEHTEK